LKVRWSKHVYHAQSRARNGAFVAGWESVFCEPFEMIDTVAAVADYGYLTVSENRAAGNDETIKWGVFRVKSTSDTPGALMFVGTFGPGGFGFVFLDGGVGISLDAPILEDRDLVFFNQRGTKHAIPSLPCPEYSAVAYNAAVEGWTREQRNENITRSLQACYDFQQARDASVSLGHKFTEVPSRCRYGDPTRSSPTLNPTGLPG